MDAMSTQLSPRLVVAGAARAIDFYVTVFDAKEIVRYTHDDGTIVHAELAIGDSVIMIKEEDGGDPGPVTLGGSPVLMALKVDDADAVGERMLAAGSTVVFPIDDQDYGEVQERGGRLKDPFGHLWIISQPL